VVVVVEGTVLSNAAAAVSKEGFCPECFPDFYPVLREVG
jgi:hypothetical protein